MTLQQLHSIKLWHLAHKPENPLEYHTWDGVLTAWMVGWMGEPAALILWWPRKGQWRAALLMKRGTKGFRLNRDLHGVFGFWSLPVFMILSLSGVYLVFPTTFGDGLKRTGKGLKKFGTQAYNASKKYLLHKN